jgi:tetratricopeptide (TPR) repeat protein
MSTATACVFIGTKTKPTSTTTPTTPAHFRLARKTLHDNAAHQREKDRNREVLWLEIWASLALNPMMRPSPPCFKPNDAGLCLCGSGIAYADCCKDHLPGFDRGSVLKTLWKRGDWPEALIAARADLTQYTIWHKTNTEPRARIADPAIQMLLSVDIEALGELAGDLCTIHHRLDLQAKLPAVLERLRTNISDQRWQRKVTYYQALVAESLHGQGAGAAEFKKLGEITAAETDVEILQAYLDLCRDEVSFARRIEVCDQIIRLSPSVSDHLQYGALKGFAYLDIGDFDQAGKQFAKAIAYAHMEQKRKDLSLRARHLLSGVLVIHAMLSRDDEQFSEAETIINELLADTAAWTAHGLASLHDARGELYRYWGKWAEGENAYRSALATEQSGISAVFLAECLWRQKQIDEAATEIDAVDFEALDDNGQADYAYTLASIAVEADDRDRLEAALETLKGLQIKAPYFEQRRLKFIIEVQEALACGPTSGGWTKLQTFLRGLNRYFLLQPNIAGVGVNMNAIAEDIAAPKRGRKNG